MAVVPMADGPKVQATIPDKPELGLVKTKGDVVLKEADQRLQQSTGEFMEACNRAYETMSRARADAAMNDIQIQVNDLMKGDGGALNQLGTEVVDRPDAPYVQHYDQQIGKIIHDATQNLDVHQKALIGEKLKQYRADRRLELQNHAIKQADAYQKSVAQTKSEIAAEGIAVDPGNIRSVEEKSKDIEDAYRVMHRGEPEESVAKGIKDAVSASLVSGIKALLANDEPEKAQGVLRHYRGGKLTAYDTLKVQGLIRDALQKKAAAAAAAQAANATTASLQPPSLARTMLAPATGKEYDEAAYTRTSTLVSDAGKPEWAAAAYLVGEAKAKELIGDWTKRVEEAKAKGDNAAVAKLQGEDPFADVLTGPQKAALSRYANEMRLVDSGDKEAIRRQVEAANPDADPKIIDRAVKALFTQRQHAQRVAREQANQQAASIFTLLHGGTDIDDIPAAQFEGLTDAQKAGLAEYSRRARLNSFSTDSAAYYDLAYNNQRLKEISWADLYASAGRFEPKDFDNLVNRKVRIEQGANTKDISFEVSKEVENALELVGLKPDGKTDKAFYSRVARSIADNVIDKANTDFGNGWDTTRIRQEVAAVAQSRLTQSGLWNTNYKVGDFLSKETFWNTDGLRDMADAALKATGFPEPSDVDRTEFVVTCLLNPRRPVPGESQFVAAAPPSEVAGIRAAYAKAHNGAQPDDHILARLLLKARIQQ